jgi:predicted enzyme related to lactoylglutathione lyase
MARIESYPPGSFCWAELATHDLTAAKKLYGELFGWSAVDNPIPGGGVYTMFRIDGNDVAAAHAHRPDLRPHWGVYFSVTSADETAAKVEPLGGKLIEPPFDVMDVGRMAVIQDPQGSTISIWQAKKHIGATHGGLLGRVMWPELHTPDPAGAAAFYTGLFGWRTHPASGVESAQYVEWINGETHFAGMMPMRGPEWQGLPPHWMIYITVADCDERAAKAKGLGAEVCVPPTDVPNVGRFAVISDAQGATFSMIQMTARGQAA